MTFLTKITLNPERTGARQLLSNRQRIHAAVMKAFSEDATVMAAFRPLWRLELGRRDPEILIMSSIKPDVAHIVEQGGRLNDEFGVRIADYTPVVDSIHAGARYRFKVVANPVRVVKGRRLAQVGIKNQLSWFIELAGRNGFVVNPHEVDVVDSETIRFKKGESNVTLAASTFEGALEVSDVLQFKHSVQMGLGRGRAYGLGMITLARI